MDFTQRRAEAQRTARKREKNEVVIWFVDSLYIRVKQLGNHVDIKYHINTDSCTSAYVGARKRGN